MRIFKQILICMLLSGQSIAQAETTNHDAHHAESGMEWTGVYNGFLPCADCGGVKMILALNPNKSYTLITQNVGKSIREYTEKGKFDWNESTKKLVLTPRNGEATRSFLVGENSLSLLDSHGNRYSGFDADKYDLRKLDITAKAPKHLH